MPLHNTEALTIYICLNYIKDKEPFQSKQFFTVDELLEFLKGNPELAEGVKFEPEKKNTNG